MEDLELKYVTELAQIRKIIGDNCELAHYLLSEHIDLCGAITAKEYSKLLTIPLRTVHDQVRKGKIKYIEIGESKYPCVNM